MTIQLADPTVTVDGIPIGLRRDGTPIYLHTGAEITVTDDEGPDDDDLDEGDDEDDSDEPLDDEDEDDDEPPAYVPPTQELWEKTQAAVRRNNAENMKLRGLKKTLTQQGIDLDSADGQERLADLINGAKFGDAKPAAKASDRDVARAVAREVAKVEATWKPALAEMALKDALVEAGWSGSESERKRLVNMLDLDELEIVDGKVTGIAEQVVDIKADVPSWFRTRKPVVARRSGAADVDGGSKRGAATQQPTGWLTKIDASFGG